MGKYYSINVKNNIKEFTKGLNSFQKKQVPFVAARTLTDTAFKVRENAISKSFPQAFKNSTVASRMAKGRLRVMKAQKRDYNMGMLSAKVLDKSSNPLEYLVTHQRGGMKRPKSGDYITVPSSKMKKKLGIRRNPQWRPANLRNKPNFKTFSKGSWVSGKSEKAIVEIKGKKMERAYSLVRSVPIPKRLFFEENAERTVQKKIQYIWTTQLNHALQTSRYK
jgi:hypothetical protein